jgi:hypothetical protein
MLTVKLTGAAAERLRGLARSRGLSPSEAVEQLIIEQASAGYAPDPQGLRDLDGLLTDPVKDASITDEDVLRQIFKDAHDRPD